MLQVVSLTILALLVARVVRAPRGSWRYILAAAALVVAGSQLLPEGNAFGAEVRGGLGGLVWLGLALIPVAAYALVIRRIRRRTGVDAELRPPPHPTGLVLIAEDAALARDTEAAMAAEGGAAGETLSVGWRDGAGALTGHARLRLRPGLADLEMLWVAPAARGRGIGAKLLAQAEDEARQRGAARIAATVEAPGLAGFLRARGFAPYGRLEIAGGAAREHLAKVLR